MPLVIKIKRLIIKKIKKLKKIDQNDQNEKNDQNDQDDQDDDGLGGQLLLLFFISSIVDLVTGEWEEEWLKDWGSDRFSN